MGKVTVVTSGKGGVGKSTVSTFLGRELCRLGKSVVLVELDSGLRTLDILTDMSANVLFDIGDIIEDRCTVSQAVISVKGEEKLFLLPAPAFFTQSTDNERLKLLTSKLAQIFDYVLIDCPAGVGDAFESAVSCADDALVVVTPDPVCVRDAAVVRKKLSDFGVYDRRLIINKLVCELVKDKVYYDIDTVIDLTGIRLIGAIPYDPQLIECGSIGTPLFQGSPSKIAFSNIASRICGENTPLMNLKKYC